MKPAYPTHACLRLTLALFGVVGFGACGGSSESASNYKSTADAAIPKASDAAIAIAIKVDASAAPKADAGTFLLSIDGGEQAVDPPPVADCIATGSTLLPRPPEALLVQDRSTAMAEAVASGPSRWAASTDAIAAATTSGSVAWGLMLFPKPGADSDCCQMPSSDLSPEVEVAPSVASSASLSATLAQTTATGNGRPLARAIVQAGNYLSARTSTTTKYLVLVVGGDPTCSSDGLCSGASTSDDARTKDAVTNVASLLGIPVAVAAVGLATAANSLQPGQTQQFFGDLAKLGGMANTAPGQPAYYSASNSDELGAALAAIASQMRSCSFALANPVIWRSDAEVTISGVRIAQDPSHQDGWDFADNGTSIVLFGKACASVRTASVPLSIQFTTSCPNAVY